MFCLHAFIVYTRIKEEKKVYSIFLVSFVTPGPIGI